MNTEYQLHKTAMEDWLRHEDITNLKLTAISYWRKNEKIRQFLEESTLEYDGDRRGPRGQRLCIDMYLASGAPKACRGGSTSNRIASGASAGSNDSTPAPTPHATSASSTETLRV